MAEANLTSEIIASTGLVPVSSGAWREISYIWADQLYGDPTKVLAKYLFKYKMTAVQRHVCEGAKNTEGQTRYKPRVEI